VKNAKWEMKIEGKKNNHDFSLAMFHFALMF